LVLDVPPYRFILNLCHFGTFGAIFLAGVRSKNFFGTYLYRLAIFVLEVCSFYSSFIVFWVARLAGLVEKIAISALEKRWVLGWDSAWQKERAENHLSEKKQFLLNQISFYSETSEAEPQKTCIIMPYVGTSMHKMVLLCWDCIEGIHITKSKSDFIRSFLVNVFF